MTEHQDWQPSWQTPEHADFWSRVREAMRAEWENSPAPQEPAPEVWQEAMPTWGKTPSTRPAALGITEGLPGEWEHVEPSLAYGISAQHEFRGRAWDVDLEHDLRTEWESAANTRAGTHTWSDVRPYVRLAYRYKVPAERRFAKGSGLRPAAVLPSTSGQWPRSARRA